MPLPNVSDVPPRPWYREPWPWILMGLPASAVAASLFSGWLAWTHQDGVVVDDYYKQGLAINRVLARDEHAKALGLSGDLQLNGGGVALKLLAQTPDASLKHLHLHVVHATRQGLDQEVVLEPAPDGGFRGIMHPLAAGRWLFLLEDDAHTWRLTQEAKVPVATGIHLVPERQASLAPADG